MCCCKRVSLVLMIALLLLPLFLSKLFCQIPMERVLSRITVPSSKGVRGLVDTVGFPHRAVQMDFIGALCESLERDEILKNKNRFHFSDDTHFIFGICPHDDYMLAARVYDHVQRYIKAKRIIVIGNAHWSETFGIRNRLIFGDFKWWHGPYGNVRVSEVRNKIIERLLEDCYTINSTLVETEHSLEALIPFMQYYNRDVEIVPIFIPYMDWKEIERLSSELVNVVSKIVQERNWTLGQDIAILCSTDGQHYGDYGWSYYDYHPFGCDAEGYKKATWLDNLLIKSYLTGDINLTKFHTLFSHLVDEKDISHYKITWCGRFSVVFASCFAARLVNRIEQRELEGYFLRYGSSLSDPWLPLAEHGLGLTGDANLHHFVTYMAVGFK